jgi:hypothetical protein
VSVGSRVVCYHDGLLIVGVLMYFVVCGKAGMLDLVDLFYCPIECGAQAVGGIGATLGNTNAWCATLCVGRIDCQTFLIVGVVFGQAGPFVLCEGNAVVKEQVLTIAQLPERLLNVLLPGNFALPAVFPWIRGYDGFVIVHLQCWATHVVDGGGVGLGEYGKCIMQFRFEFGL